MANPFDLSIPLTLAHSFTIGSGWSVAPEVTAKWKPVIQAGPAFSHAAATVTFTLAF